MKYDLVSYYCLFSVPQILIFWLKKCLNRLCFHIFLVFLCFFWLLTILASIFLGRGSSGGDDSSKLPLILGITIPAFIVFVVIAAHHAGNYAYNLISVSSSLNEVVNLGRDLSVQLKVSWLTMWKTTLHLSISPTLNDLSNLHLISTLMVF